MVKEFSNLLLITE